MNTRPIRHARDAHAQLVVQLCEALSTFVAATAAVDEDSPAKAPVANDNSWAAGARAPDHDVISLRGLLVEFGLKQSQVAKLRKTWGFPDPVGLTRPIMFCRSEVEQWAQRQPNRNNLAIVLRCRKKSKSEPKSQCK